MRSLIWLICLIGRNGSKCSWQRFSSMQRAGKFEPHLMFQASSTSTPFASALTARRESGGRRKTSPLELVSSILFVTCSHEKGIDPCNTTRNISCVTLLQLSFVYNSDADHEVLLAVPFRNLRLNRNRVCPPDATSCLCCFGSFHHPAPSCCRSH